MAAIETTADIIDKIRVFVSRNGIDTIRKLQIIFAEKAIKEHTILRQPFMTALTKCHIYLSKHDESSIIGHYKSSELEVNYLKFLNDVSPNLTTERLAIVQKLFDLTQKDNYVGYILYSDLMSFCDPKNHPNVVSGEFVESYAKQMIINAFQDIGDDKGKISFDEFVRYFNGISAAYPYHTNAFIKLIQFCWMSLFKNDDGAKLEMEEASKYICQIEAMLAEKTRQKVRGSESENTTLLRAFKHWDIQKLGYLPFDKFVQCLQSFGVMAPNKEMQLFFDKWSDEQNHLQYRPFILQIFKLY